MKDKKDKKTDSGSYVSKQAAAGMVIAALFAGFLGGVVFAVFKAPSPALPPSSPPVQGHPPSDIEEHTKSLEAEVLARPDNVEAWVLLGHAYFDAGENAKAIGAYEKSLELSPGNADVLTDLGVMYRRNGKPEKAVEAFDRAIAADPSHQTARFNKGIVLLHDLNDHEGAIRAWEELLEINPLAMAGNGQSVDQLVTHYKKHVRKEGDRGGE
jgi:cytochrome c-type biogenesis protein CcmH/NrfG